MRNFLLEFITPIVSILSIFISYYLGQKSIRKDLLKKTIRYRYMEVYVPYIQLIAKELPFLEYPITDTNLALKISQMTLGNIQFLGDKSSRQAIKFYESLLNYLEYSDGNSDYPDAEKEINLIFLQMTQEILLEASDLSKELHLVDLGQYFYNEISNYPCHTETIKQSNLKK